MALAVPDYPPLATRGYYNAALRFIDRHVEQGRGKKIAVIHDDGYTTYEELWRGVNQVGNALKELGLEMENRLVLACYDSVEFITTFFGAIKIGAVPVPVNTMLSPFDYAYMLNDSRAKILVVEDEVWNRIAPLPDPVPHLKHVVVIHRTQHEFPPGCFDFHQLMKAQPDELAVAETLYDDAAFWLYTSGSTGRPKGVVHLQHDMELAYHHYARGILGITEDDTTFSASKLFFAYGMGNGMYFSLGAGASTVLMRERPTPQSVCQRVERHRPTLFFGVPTLYAALLDWVRTGRSADFSSVRLCVSAGEPLPAAIYQRFYDRFGVEILDGIGSTEALHIYISNRPGQTRPGSTGQVVPGYEIQIVNDEGRPAGPRESGQLLLKGDSLAQGYWNLHEQTKMRFRGEWYVTGDRYYMDEDGYLWYCGRQDDMLKSGGIWVSPIEIENTLLEHDAVLEAAVVGEEDENGIQKPVAYVVLKPGYVSAVEEELRNLVRDRLAHYKCPKRFVFVDALPKTETGKIQRFKLRTTRDELRSQPSGR